MKKDKTDLIIDELLEAYAKDLAEEDFKEFAHYFEEDEQYLANKHLVEDVQYEPAKPKKKSFNFAKYVAAAAAVLIIFSVAIPTEASAWRIWDLRFLFGDRGDHTLVTPDSQNQFPQYYVLEKPKGFDVVFEDENNSQIYIQYRNSEGQYIIYMQAKESNYISQLDSEKHVITEELIGDFKVAVCKGEETIFEAITDSVAIFVQTNAGYEFGKVFFENLKEI